MTDVVIETMGLCKEFTVLHRIGRLRRERRTVTAVAEIDLSVRRGELVGYIGPNGAGKSTMMKLLAGILAPSSGRVRVCGLEPVRQRSILARRIGVLFGQRSALWWDLPLVESFQLLRHIYRVPEADHLARFASCRTMLGLDEFLHTPVRQLSLGQRMRGELTAALLHGPEVLFLDEPTIGLDVLSKQAVRGFLAELGKRGDTTVVLTTHDLVDIERLCSRLIVVDGGRVIHDGTIAELHRLRESRRRIVVELAEPWPSPAQLPGVSVESVEAGGRRLTLALSHGSTDDVTYSAGDVIGRLADLTTLRDVSVLEPDIEDVVAGLYRAGR